MKLPPRLSPWNGRKRKERWIISTFRGGVYISVVFVLYNNKYFNADKDSEGEEKRVCTAVASEVSMK